MLGVYLQPPCDASAAAAHLEQGCKMQAMIREPFWLKSRREEQDEKLLVDFAAIFGFYIDS